MSTEAEFERVLDDLSARAPDGLSLMGAAVLSAVHCGLARDSRSFAAKLGLAHALVLREAVSLAEEHNLISVENRGEKSARLHLALTAQGQHLFAEAAAA